MNLVDRNKDLPLWVRFQRLPRRVFLDSNVIQYLSDFGEFIFDNCMEDASLITTRGKQIPEDTFLFNQLICLNRIFLGLDRTSIHFAISDFIYQEVQKKNDPKLTSYFSELRQNWNTIIEENGENALTGYGKRKMARIQSDKSIINGLSKSDFQVLSDALVLECDAILTCDRYRNRQNWIYDKYRIMLLYPSDFMEIIQDFQALWY
jgi:hypothetical protein